MFAMDIELKKFEQLKATGELPSPRGVALTIVRLTQRDDVSSGQLEQIIKSDPAFVGRLLKAANISGRDMGRPVASVPDALNVLGVVVVRNLALGFSLVSGYRSGACSAFDYPAFWTRAVLNALALQAVVRSTGVANPEEAFCCGLLSEIGKLALATLYPAEYSRILQDLSESAATTSPEAYSAALRAREQEAFALHHDDLTAAMLSDWGFPRALVEPLFFRHRPEFSGFAADSRGERMLFAVQLAQAMTDVCLAEPEGRPALVAPLAGRAVRLRIEPEVLENMIDGVMRGWDEWAGMLQIGVRPNVSFAPPSSVFADLLRTQQDTAAATGADEGPRALRVLLAGCDDEQRIALSAALGAQGYEVFAADNGQRALEVALSVQPHILIVDWQLPELDGVQLTRALRDTRMGRGMYVLILTGREDDDRLVEAFEAGADDYLVKPVRDKILAARLRAATRVVQLQEDVRRDHEEMKHFAAELAVSNRRLHEAAVTDPLTGFHNRRFAMDRLEKEWASSSRSGRPVSCMMIDIDNFKTINDTYGHDIGDRVLISLAEVLNSALRANDIVCRVGGDEFLVISTDTDANAIRACAERLLAAAGQAQVESPQGPVRCGISIGVATRDASMVSTAMLIKAADVGMYRAKLGGRARIGEGPD